MSILDRLFGDPNAREMKKIEPVVAQVNKLEEGIQKLPDAKFKDRYLAIKDKVMADLDKEKNKTEDKESQKKIEIDILTPHIPEVFALTREAARRTIMIDVIMIATGSFKDSAGLPLKK